MPEPRATYFLQRHGELKAEKGPWLPLLQSVAKVFSARKATFTSDPVQGEFLQDDIFDNIGQFAANLGASMFLSMLWPDSARTFRIVPVRALRNEAGVEDFFKEVMTPVTQQEMDRPEAGLQLALLEHFLEGPMVFGTSGVGTFDGPADKGLPLVYESWGVKSMCIDENAQGFVDTIYDETGHLTVRQVFEEYNRPGSQVSQRLRELYQGGKYDQKVKVLKVIYPRTPERGKKGIAAMPYGTVHIDVEAKFIMRRGGFEEMPVAVSRSGKRTGEKYGRSCAMVAQPDALSRMALKEGVMVATEKQLAPPLLVLDSGRLGGGVVDSSPDGVTVVETSGRLGEKPIQPLYTVGELSSSHKLLEMLGDDVMQAFYLDRLLDLNNPTQMTAYETSVRNRLRGEALSSLFAREEKETLTPTIKRSISKLWRAGYYGFGSTGEGAKQRRAWERITGRPSVQVPRAVLAAIEAGLDIYEIEYVSPAKRFMQAEKLQGLFQAADALLAAAPLMPTVLDNVDPDKFARDVYDLSGAPLNSLRTADDLKVVRAANKKQTDAAQTLEVGKSVAEIAQMAGQARASLGTTRK